MQLVIDANILVAAFLKAATTRRLLLDSRLKLHAPEDLLIEGRKVLKERLSKRLKINPDFDFDILFDALTNNISILSVSDYASCLDAGLRIAPHDEDAPYLACALCLAIPLWTNDSGIRSQIQVPTFSTIELLAKLSGKHP